MHCSTAVVAGATRASRVLESVLCVPVTPYERTKLALELRVLNAVKKGLDVGILRPTAIVGCGGTNLVKLARSLRHDSSLTNYVRASLFGKRAMHIVSVRNVVAAIFHVATISTPLRGSIYHISSDDDPNNNFKTVETILLQVLGLRSRRLPIMRVPAQMLSILLKSLGRSDTDPTRIYDNRKLLDTNFKPVESVEDAVRSFGAYFRSNNGDIVNRSR